MKQLFLAFTVLFILQNGMAQKTAAPVKTATTLPRPKLVVGIVVDQMRWDFLYRYYGRYGNGGFKRLMGEGFSCENTFIPYTPTVTAAGHTCIYTGSVPAIHGIVGNDWIDNATQKKVYCSEDNAVAAVGNDGSESKNGKQSPRNMLVTTIGDEIRLATNFRSKVIGVALKDRGSILPAGHKANAAYWYDVTTGNWITSTYYMNDLPQWAKAFNAKKLVDSFYTNGWNTLYPVATYAQSTADEEPYESKPFGDSQTKFPYNLSKYKGKSYQAIATTPFGNTMTMQMAEAAIDNEQLGKGIETDMLCVSFSSTDYVGHAFGPNSLETEDTYLRLDKDLATFFNYLDEKVGKGQYTVFLSADHGVAHVPGFMKENNLPGGVVAEGGLSSKEMSSKIKEKFGVSKAVLGVMNYQVYLNHNAIDSANADEKSIGNWIINYLQQNDAVQRAFLLKDLSVTTLNAKMKDMFANGYNPSRSGDIQIVFKPGYIEGHGDGSTGTTHGLWAPYDAHIPLLFYGWGIKQGHTNRETYMTDIAATITALLHVQMPSGCVGKVVEEAFK
ncbi:alkaline phosphatase PafA [Parasediminibacterium sp. JCM 36343]|uniref:alkaline phosphatase PafA n=1 Tax=Parasediminibacterium sp. JCM 36343 TaxID=3374279 RepID=UPI00397D1C54